jgi:hypothetical protein
MTGLLIPDVSLALLVVGGVGYAVLMLVAPEIPLYWFESCAFAFLLGMGAISLAWAMLMPTYGTVRPLGALSAFAFAVFLIALRPMIAVRKRGAASGRSTGLVVACSALLILEFCAIVLASLHLSLGSDGLVNFEWKARIAFEHQPVGQLPLAYFADTSRIWSHPRYPLLLPFAEFWIYSWLGHIDQSAIKLLFPLFYFSLTAVMCGAVRRLTNGRIAIATGVALGSLPMLTVGQGGATSGFADIPLAAAAVAAVSCTILAIRTSNARAFVLAGALSTVGAWTKVEGLVLALYLGCATLGAVLWMGRRNPSRRVPVFAAAASLWMPLTVTLPWMFLQRRYGMPEEDFLSMSPAVAFAHLDRLPVVIRLVAHELLRRDWALIWPAFAAAVALTMWRREWNTITAVLAGAVIVPLGTYILIFLFSGFADVTQHVLASVERLLIPLAPTALIFTVSLISRSLTSDEHLQ